VDPVTGHVKSWVGGINHKYFQYDHVNSNVSRQVGSTFKPFIYATAIALQGISPCFEVIDIPVTILPGEGNFSLLKEWTPRNADGEYTGDRLTLREGLRQSKNTVSVYLMRQLGDTRPVRGLIHNMGIDSTRKYPNGQPRVPRQPSIALGAASLSVYEMTGAYTTFANNGLYNKPIFISRIEDKNGRVIYEELPEEHLALNPSANYVMVDMLRYAGKLGGLKSDAGGKTGTTNSFVDGWFMGVTPSLVVGTWVGGEDNWIRFRSLMYGQGGRMAKPFFVDLIKRLENDPKADYDVKARFTRPAGDLGIVIDCGEYQNETDEVDPKGEEDPFDEDPFGEDPFGEEDEFGDGEIDFQ
ncbi:MAG: penicillin-binding transpeptidase domain-containing protein, partial [Saprospiraceae bacterium]